MDALTFANRIASPCRELKGVNHRAKKFQRQETTSLTITVDKALLARFREVLVKEFGKGGEKRTQEALENYMAWIVGADAIDSPHLQDDEKDELRAWYKRWENSTGPDYCTNPASNYRLVP